MKRLFLFDIDGTLVESGNGDRFAQSINNLHNLDVKIEKDYHGWTDRLILTALLEDEGWPTSKIIKAMPELLRELDRVHKASFSQGSVKVLPGVRELLSVLKKRGETLGLITGNIEIIAKRKLTDAGIYSYFSVGGFGNDQHTKRADLIKIAIARAQFSNNIKNVYVIGDTPRDIWATKEAGVANSVGVANGYRNTQELLDAGAKIVLEDFKDTKHVLTELGL